MYKDIYYTTVLKYQTLWKQIGGGYRNDKGSHTQLISQAHILGAIISFRFHVCARANSSTNPVGLSLKMIPNLNTSLQSHSPPWSVHARTISALRLRVSYLVSLLLLHSSFVCTATRVRNLK